MTVYYSENGLWLEEIQEGIKVGISAKGQDDLGEVMFVDLTPETTQVEKDATLIGVEAAKAVTELTSPVKGQVVAWNLELSENPELLNSTKKEDNWIVILDQVDKELLSSLAISE
ncbi:glycine cleavage system protein H [Carnobacterium maltaromaticum]|uniref:glycine cleavage system protein H n=1 Tax=Carnobacterium maltaromaticum TaxID=2751 RepID=UPI00295E929C|nr:glycine cleavage system protein H [Carnobacterium maltaromaticum]